MNPLHEGQPLLFGRYRLTEALEPGGYGALYLAEDSLSGETVVVKFLAANAPGLRRERAALRGLRLPATPALLDEGEHEGRPVLVMEHVPGAPLFTPHMRPTALEEALVSSLGVLRAFHAAGALHLDLKPAHVLRRPDGSVALLDFGLSGGPALHRQPTRVTGYTLRYAAPEQILDEPVDDRTDLYAVGLMAYEALTGLLPHDETRLRADRVRLPPTPLRVHAPGLPAKLSALIDRLLANDQRDRPSAAEALADLAPAAPAWLDRLLPAQGPALDLAACVTLFTGPRPFLRLPERAGEALLRRCQGDRGLARAELRAWQELGLIRFVDARPLVDDEALRRLDQPAFAALLGKPTPPAPLPAPAALLHEARALRSQGALRRAEGLLAAALSASEDPALHHEAAGAWLRLALAEGLPGSLERLRYALERRPVPIVESLCKAALFAARGEGERSLDQLPEDPGEPLLRECALIIRLHAAASAPTRAAEARAEARALVQRWGQPELEARLRIGEARAAYAEGRYREAARAFEAAAVGSPSERAAALNYAALTWLELPEAERGPARAREALALAEAHGLAIHACRATYALRAHAWRDGEPLDPDPGLVDAARALGVPSFVGQHALNEAAFAWRAGALALAEALTEQAHVAFRASANPGGQMLARALLAQLRGEPAPSVVAQALTNQLPDLDWQALGLLAPWLDEAQRTTALAMARRAPYPDRRRELLAPRDAIKVLITTEEAAAT